MSFYCLNLPFSLSNKTPATFDATMDARTLSVFLHIVVTSIVAGTILLIANVGIPFIYSQINGKDV